MSPRKPVKPLQLLATEALAEYFLILTDAVSTEIIAQSNKIIADSHQIFADYRKEAMSRFVEELQEMIMPSIAPSVLEDVVKQVCFKIILSIAFLTY